MSEFILSGYSSLLVSWLIVSVLGAIAVAATDATRTEEGRLVPQH